jgi:hypothetical protein
MKSKAKFSAGGLKQFMLLHVEKLVFGVVCVALLLLVYKGATRDTLKAESSPKKLSDLASQVRQKVESSPWDPSQAQVTNIKFVQEAERNQALIDPTPYVTKRDWHGQGSGSLRRRDPELFAPLDLRAMPGYGAFAMVDPNFEEVTAAASRTEAGQRDIELDENGNPIRGGRRRNQDQEQGGYGAPAGGRGGAGYGPPPGGRGGAGYGGPGGGRGGAGYGPPPGGRGGAGYGPPRGGAGYGAPGGGYGGGGMSADGAADAVMTAQPGSKVETRHWAGIYALVPIQKQNRAYTEALGGAESFDPSSDFPNYYGYEVERVDVTNEPSAAEIDWTKATKKLVKPDVVAKEAEKWSTETPELVDEMYVQQNLVFPLGPLLQKSWKRWATHPKIPLAMMGPAFEEPATNEDATKQKNLDSLDADPDAEDPSAGGYAGGAGYGGGGGYGRSPGGYGGGGRGGAGYGMPPRGGAGYGMPPRGGGGYGRSPAGYGGGGGYGRGGAGYGAPRGGGGYGMSRGGYGGGGYGGGGGFGETQIQISHSLMRHFDFDVQPGRKYRYRVRLVLRDPNHKRPPNELVKPRSSKAPWYRYTPYSEPTAVVTIPPDGDLLAGAVSNRAGEPSAKIMALSYVPKEMAEAAKEMDVTRGVLANFRQTVKVMKTKAPDPVSTNSGETEKTTASAENLNFRSDLLVVDIRGGEKLANSKGRNSELTEPGELLLLGPGGQLIVRGEIDDFPDYRSKLNQIEQIDIAHQSESAPVGGDDGTGRRGARSGGAPGYGPPGGGGRGRGN